MIIKDMLTGHAHEYGTNPHDSLIVSEDGRSLAYYNLQNGDGSRFGDYRFVGDDQEGYWNIGGASIFVPERKTGKWKAVHGYCTPGGDPVWACSECGKGLHVYGIEHGSYGRDVSDGQWKACPNCGAKMEGEEYEID